MFSRKRRPAPTLVRVAVRVGCFRRRATGVAEEWPSRTRRKPRAIQNPAYRPSDLKWGLGGHTAGPPPIYRARTLANFGVSLLLSEERHDGGISDTACSLCGIDHQHGGERPD